MWLCTWKHRVIRPPKVCSTASANRGKWEQETERNSLFSFSKPSRLTPGGQQDKTRNAYVALNVTEGHILSGQTLTCQVLGRTTAWAGRHLLSGWQSKPLAVKGQVLMCWVHHPKLKGMMATLLLEKGHPSIFLIIKKMHHEELQHQDQNVLTLHSILQMTLYHFSTTVW